MDETISRRVVLSLKYIFLKKKKANSNIPIEQPSVYHHADKPKVNAAWAVPTVEDPPTIVPTIPPRTKSDDALFLPVNYSAIELPRIRA